jgi:KipI family sensor histidine kinase inhibitor
MTLATALRVREYGDHALLLEFDSTAEVMAWSDALRAADLLGMVDVVPGSRTVLIKFDRARYLEPARRRLDKLCVEPSAATEPPAAADAVIDVHYDGADLEEVASMAGLDVTGVIAAHTGTPWRVAFCGFAPGFAYLVGGDPRLEVSRRAEPRTRVPAGSVGLAGEFSGIYPRESLGGWQLIGRTDAVLWDIHRPDPALLTPGMWVKFRAASGGLERSDSGTRS